MLLIQLQTSLNEIFHIEPDFTVIGESHRFIDDRSFHDFDMTIAPRRVAKEHFIEYQAQTPDITFGRVLLGVEELRSHINGSSTDFFHPLEIYVNFLGEPIVSYFVSVPSNQYIFRFHISVDISFVEQHTEPRQNFDEGINAFILF